MKVVLAIFFSTCFFSLTLAQDTYSNKKFTIQELGEDFTVFRESLEESHPGLYWFNSKDEMDRLFNDVSASLNHSMTEKEFFPKLNRIVAKIGCLHTNISPSELLVKSYFTEDTRYFPFELKFLDGKAFIYRNVSKNDNIKPGSEVVAINGIQMDSITSQLLRYLSSDGYGKGWASYSLEKVFSVYYRFFIDDSEKFRISIKEFNEQEKHLIIDGLPNYKMDSLKKIRYGSKSKSEPFIQLTWNKELNTAILRILRFENWETGKKKYQFKRVLKENMQKIIDSGVDNLVLDVGDRGGGHEGYGLTLLSYFINEPFKGYKAIEFSNKKFSARKYSKTSWAEYAFFRTMMRFKKTDSTYLLTSNKSLKPVKPALVHFTGNIYLITSRTTASATSDFAAWVHSLGFATIVGEETGGGYFGNTSNWEFNIILPNTNIQINIPLARYISNVREDIPLGRGVIPEYSVSPTIEDILSGVDTQLVYVLELIREANK